MLDIPGNKTDAKVSTMPTSKAATKAPFMDPIPPITTTTKQDIKTLSPIPGTRLTIGADTMPALSLIHI